MKILLAGGGSIGHVAPCVAVARALLELQPNTSLQLVCAKREEEQSFLAAEKLPFAAITLPRLRFSAPLAFPRALREAKNVVDSFRPDGVFCAGGSVGVPIAWRAQRRGIPIVLHESDALMGRANRLIARWARTVCQGMQPHASNAQIPKSDSRSPKSVYTGNPVRPELWNGSKEEGLRITGFSGTRPILLVIGGSQGAQALNDAVRRLLPSLLPLCDVLHITGMGKGAAPPASGYWSAPFVRGELAHFYAIATVALSRGGANSIGELAANGVPSLLVPLEGVARNHQKANASVAVLAGGCMLQPQSTLDEKLLPMLRHLITDRTALEEMSQKIRTLWHPDAAKEIARVIVKAIDNNGGFQRFQGNQ